jgi:hypothetical protein
MVYWIIPSATQACIAFILSYNHKQWGPSTRKKECTLPAEIVLYTCHSANTCPIHLPREENIQFSPSLTYLQEILK